MANPEKEPKKIVFNCPSCTWTNYLDAETLSKALKNIYYPCQNTECKKNIFTSDSPERPIG